VLAAEEALDLVGASRVRSLCYLDVTLAFGRENDP
jgi:hypothetical protein